MNEEKRLDVEKKDIEIRLLKLDLYEKASNLIRDGVVRADSLEIDINGLMFLLLEDGTATPGEDIDSIEEAGSTEPPN